MLLVSDTRPGNPIPACTPRLRPIFHWFLISLISIIAVQSPDVHIMCHIRAGVIMRYFRSMQMRQKQEEMLVSGHMAIPRARWKFPWKNLIPDNLTAWICVIRFFPEPGFVFPFHCRNNQTRSVSPEYEYHPGLPANHR